MSESPVTTKKFSIDPGKISAWISLGSTVFGLLTALVNITDSQYNPIDTIFIYILYVTIMLYAFSGLAFAALVGASKLVGEETCLNQVAYVVAGIFILVTAVPLAIENATDTVRFGDFDGIAITFTRFVAVGMFVLAFFLIREYILKSNTQS